MTDLSRFSLEYAAPADDLKEMVSSFYWFRVDIAESRETERAERAQFRFVLKGGGGYEFCDGTYMESTPVTIIGPTTGPTTGVIKGPLEIFGAGLQPAGWGALMGSAAEQYTNRLLDPTEIFGEGLLDVRSALAAASTMEAKTGIANNFARDLLVLAGPSPFWFTRIVDDWLAASPSPDIVDLIAETGLSKRQLERITKRYYGSPPKQLARKFRALRAASALLRNETSTEELLADGFYDQSHLIRELKQFTGLTPGQMAGNAEDRTSQLNRQVATGRKGLSGEVGTLISDT